MLFDCACDLLPVFRLCGVEYRLDCVIAVDAAIAGDQAASGPDSITSWTFEGIPGKAVDGSWAAASVAPLRGYGYVAGARGMLSGVAGRAVAASASRFWN